MITIRAIQPSHTQDSTNITVETSAGTFNLHLVESGGGALGQNEPEPVVVVYGTGTLPIARVALATKRVATGWDNYPPVQADEVLSPLDQFAADLAGQREVFHYHGRSMWHGPAVKAGTEAGLQEVIRTTAVPLQWDSLGEGFVIYPKDSDPRSWVSCDEASRDRDDEEDDEDPAFG
jgi:hypothetical protein